MAGFTGPYRLIVSVNLPEEVIEGEVFEGEYVFTNDSEVPFPGVNAGILVTWPEIGQALTVYDPTDLGEIDIGSQQTIPLKHTPPTSGITVFTINPRAFNRAVDGLPIEYYLPDGRLITRGQLIASVRVKSAEEVLQEKTIRTFNKSIESQDKLTETQNRLARVSIYLTVAEVFVAIAALYIAYVAFKI